MLGSPVALTSGETQLPAVLAITLAFALFARILRAVSLSGAISGGLICFALFWSVGMGGFFALVTVFVLTWSATKFGYRRKQKLGTAERSAGRTASQVLANLGAAAAFAVLFRVKFPHPALLVAAIAALAEAAADTVSSEFGQSRADAARLITTWKKVSAGTDGGITVSGTLAGVASAAVVALVSWCSGLLSAQNAWIAALGGTSGMMVDSLLGATLERDGKLTNDWVNLLSTLVAAGIGGIVTVFWQ
jgi:uncharacterized protein (TIGR00297 family)